MNATTQTRGKAMRRVIRIAKVITPARLLRVLAMGAMLIAATALAYQGLNQEAVDSLSSSNQVTQAAPAQLGSEAPEAEGISSDAAPNSTVDRTLSNMELERMDYAADRMLWAAAHQPSASRPFSTREIERLEDQIDSLLADADRDPSKNTQLLDRDVQRLEDQIHMLREAALHDRALADQLADAEEQAYDELSKNFIGIPYSSEPIGTWPPDTEYYQDPDWREGQIAK